MYKNPVDPATWPTGSLLRRVVGRIAFGVSVTMAVFIAALYGRSAAARAGAIAYWSHLKIAPGFRPEVFTNAPQAVQIHALAALFSLVVGGIIFSLPKGSPLHRLLGWSWVTAMAVVAISSIVMIFDKSLGLSPLHAFTVITIVSLTGGLRHIKRGDVSGHAGYMTGLYFGGLILSGIFAVAIPGRTLWRLFFG